MTSEAYLKVCDSGHEVHAGVGVIREYGLTLHPQRSRTLYHLLGIDPDTVVKTPAARPVKLIAEDAPIIKEAIG